MNALALKNIAACALFGILALSSCQNNNSNSLIVGHWSLVYEDDGSGLTPFDEYFVWELNSDGTGFSRYREDGTGPLVSFPLIWELTADDVLRISEDGGQDWTEEEVQNLTNTELWTYDAYWEEWYRYEKIQ